MLHGVDLQFIQMKSVNKHPVCITKYDRMRLSGSDFPEDPERSRGIIYSQMSFL